ncbi:glycoside hydrolase family 20 zincin-like fold domain-containing protein [Lysobacter korlensis]|uniref:Glycoside hydrolase family 20 zincin-like fold domain-containing protein n=1 Tax=Lysobacter korlensis TaxID=553636 RepID=A0ABV6RT07_9GAMM
MHPSIDEDLGAEAYGITIDGSGIRIRGGDPAGVFYARQTLRHLCGDRPADQPASHPSL